LLPQFLTNSPTSADWWLVIAECPRRLHKDFVAVTKPFSFVVDTSNGLLVASDYLASLQYAKNTLLFARLFLVTNKTSLLSLHP
jgi:hypothetical protein